MPKFSFERIVNSKRESVFSVFSSYENYQKILPQHFPSIRLRSVRENVAVVEEHMNLGDKEFVVMAKHVEEKISLHEVFIIGGDLKGSHISQQFIEIGNQTKVILNIKFKFWGRMKLSNIFGKSKIQEDYVKIVDDFINIIEKDIPD